jgi:hypothetical protein
MGSCGPKFLYAMRAVVQFSLRTLMVTMALLCFIAWSLRDAVLNSALVADGQLAGPIEIDGEQFETSVLVVRQLMSGQIDFYKAATTEPDGNFTMQLRPGLYDVYVSLAGPDDFLWNQPLLAWQQVSIRPRKTTPIRPMTSLMAVAPAIRIPSPTRMTYSEAWRGK